MTACTINIAVSNAITVVYCPVGMPPADGQDQLLAGSASSSNGDQLLADYSQCAQREAATPLVLRAPSSASTAGQKPPTSVLPVATAKPSSVQDTSRQALLPTSGISDSGQSSERAKEHDDDDDDDDGNGDAVVYLPASEVVSSTDSGSGLETYMIAQPLLDANTASALPDICQPPTADVTSGGDYWRAVLRDSAGVFSTLDSAAGTEDVDCVSQDADSNSDEESTATPGADDSQSPGGYCAVEFFTNS